MKGKTVSEKDIIDGIKNYNLHFASDWFELVTDDYCVEVVRNNRFSRGISPLYKIMSSFWLSEELLGYTRRGEKIEGTISNLSAASAAGYKIQAGEDGWREERLLFSDSAISTSSNNDIGMKIAGSHYVKKDGRIFKLYAIFKLTDKIPQEYISTVSSECLIREDIKSYIGKQTKDIFGGLLD